MMGARHFYLWTVLVVVVVAMSFIVAEYGGSSPVGNELTGMATAVLSASDKELKEAAGCTKDEECAKPCKEEGGYTSCYCVKQVMGAGKCYGTVATTPPPAKTETKVPVINETKEILALKQQVSTVKTEVDVATKDVDSLELKDKNLEGRVAQLEADAEELDKKLIQISNNVQQLASEQLKAKGELQQNIGKVSTGLAAAQQDVKILQTNVTNISSVVAQEQSSRKFLSYTFFTLLTLSIGLGLIYYMTQGKKDAIRGSSAGVKVRASEENEEDTGSGQLQGYISKHLKQGKKYGQIKQNLLSVGWAVEDVEEAFKKTMQTNFSAAGKVAGKAGVNGKNKDYQHKAMAMVGGLVIVLAIFAVMMANNKETAAGHAIFYDKLVDGKKNGTIGEVTYSTKCTPPHILTPSGDGCCVDANDNKVCDYDEQRIQELQQQLAETGKCTDNSQCGVSKKCVSGECISLVTIYEGKGDCSKSCNFYAVKFTTSDGEEYTVKAGKGSYTAVGALEWRIANNVPDHCKGEQVVIPVEIIKKNPQRIISEEIILLHKGEQSPVLTHPDLKDVAFTLKVEDVKELCN